VLKISEDKNPNYITILILSYFRNRAVRTRAPVIQYIKC